MRFKIVLFVFVVLVLNLRSEGCGTPPPPGLVELNVLVEEKGVAQENILIGLFRNSCLIDSFSTDSAGEAYYSFLAEEENIKSDDNSYSIRIIPIGTFGFESGTIGNSGKHSFTLEAVKTKPLLSILVKGRDDASFMHVYSKGYSKGYESAPYCKDIELENLSIFSKYITTPEEESQFVFDVVPNDSTFIVARKDVMGFVVDTVFAIYIEEEMVELVID